MPENILVIRNEEPRINTWELAKGFKVEHRAIKRLLKKYQSEFEQLGFITTPLQQIKKKKGRQIDGLELNEPQATYMATLLTNNDNVRAFKLKMTKQFFEMRKMLTALAVQKQNADWIEKRDAGKLQRRLETDAIKSFIEYAKSQGSKSAEKYYMIITKMENQSLLNLDLLQQEFSNLRDVIDVFSLSALQIADVIVANALKEGMKLSLFYKDIYIRARDRVEGLALSMGKTPLRLALKDTKQLTEKT